MRSCGGGQGRPRPACFRFPSVRYRPHTRAIRPAAGKPRTPPRPAGEARRRGHRRKPTTDAVRPGWGNLPHAVRIRLGAGEPRNGSDAFYTFVKRGRRVRRSRLLRNTLFLGCEPLTRRNGRRGARQRLSARQPLSRLKRGACKQASKQARAARACSQPSTERQTESSNHRIIEANPPRGPPPPYI